MSKHFIILLTAVALSACGGKTGSDTGDTSGTTTSGDGGATGTTTGATTSVTANCNTAYEDCAPGTCGGEGANMTPGSDCIACHSPGNYGEEGNAYWSAAGTIFTDINGSAGASDAIIRVTDSNGTVVEMTSLSSGNFYTSDPLSPPLSAEIEVNGNIRAMITPVKTGACSTCHRCDGAAGGKMYTP